MVTIMSAFCTFIREVIFGTTSENVGLSIRQRLFEAITAKDVNFFDNIRTGSLLSRIGSDTNVVQNGMTTNVS